MPEKTSKIDVEFGTKEQAMWEDVKEKTIQDIENQEKQLVFLKGVVELAEQKIKDEKKRFNKEFK